MSEKEYSIILEGHMGTFEGYILNMLDPQLDYITIGDIAHSLALTNRYNGHTYVPYSVAQHCVRMSQPDMPGDPLTNLLHDAAEAYLGDIISPIKARMMWVYSPGNIVSIPQYESFLLGRITKALGHEGLNFDDPLTKKADKIMLVTEMRDLMWASWGLSGVGNFMDVDLLPERIVPWGWEEAEKMFYERYKELTDVHTQT